MIWCGAHNEQVLNVVFFLTNKSWAPKRTRHLKWHTQGNESSLKDNRASMRRLIEQGSAAANEEYRDDPESAHVQSSAGPRDSEDEQRPRVEPSQLTENGNEWRNE